MKEVYSDERSTGMGATRYTGIWNGEKFVRVSDMPGAEYVGRTRGVETYRCYVNDFDIVAHFYRSNRGNESVEVEGFGEYSSFSEANRDIMKLVEKKC